ncbi:MAG: LysM peptidoglycan-binding domain-containing protein [Actinomycetota bacterium]|nr:LysM peptidoglycan-binding domain-containing protein [Actinomycetota bacterium]
MMRKALVVTGILAALLLPGAARVGARQSHAPQRKLVHVVHAGDTLWGIAREVAPQKDVLATVDRLVRENHLGSRPLRPGEPLFFSGS